MQVALAVPLRVWVGFAFVFGLVVGSFLNVVIYRLPREESIVHPGSHCPGCGAPVRWWDNVPLVSYLWLRGRCRGCRARISLRYPLVELLTGALFAAVALRFGPVPMAVVGCAFAAALVATAAIDFDHQIIPDEISLGGLAVALVAVPAASWLAGVPATVASAEEVSAVIPAGAEPKPTCKRSYEVKKNSLFLPFQRPGPPSPNLGRITGPPRLPPPRNRS